MSEEEYNKLIRIHKSLFHNLHLKYYQHSRGKTGGLAGGAASNIQGRQFLQPSIGHVNPPPHSSK